MSAKTVDTLLDERARLVTKNAETDGHLWAAEFLLLRTKKLMARLLAERPADAVARDTLVEEIGEFLTEDRPHPATGAVADVAAGPDGSGKVPDGSAAS